MKKLYMILTLLSIVLGTTAQTVWDGTSATWTQGSGTADAPYLIETPQHLAYLGEQVKAGTDYEGKFFKLTQDLNMGGAEGRVFPPIGFYYSFIESSDASESTDQSKYFKGTFDGNYKTIDNLHINFKPTELGGTGLFACTTTSTCIQNLVLGAKSKIEGAEVTGSIVGIMVAGILQNCQNNAEVIAESYTGGLVGSTEKATIINCSNKGKVNGVTEVGGIVGSLGAGSVVKGCYNTAAVTATGFGGSGIVGSSFSSFFTSSTISNCYSIGAVAGLESLYLGKPQAICASYNVGDQVSNCFYIKELTGFDDEKGSAITDAQLKDVATLALLNADLTPAAFVADTENTNGGLPILSWETKLSTGIARVLADARTDWQLAVDGRTLTADRSFEVRTLSGAVVAEGRRVTVAAAGVYVVTPTGKAAKSHKIIIK